MLYVLCASVEFCELRILIIIYSYCYVYVIVFVLYVPF
jgi:hypothetical protein